MAEPHEMTIAQAAAQIRERQLSPVELMESLLTRAEGVEPSLEIWVTLDRDVALSAARRSEQLLTQSDDVGPLHGIPVGIKDIYYTEGMLTTCCSPIFADFVPTYDSTAVARLKSAGAIVMGKTVTTQFACGDPSPTKNPWNASHTPGGSSSGSAVGVAVGAFPASLGSQTGGSVLRPASYNGVVGLKPTFGRISRYGVVPVAWSLDTMGSFTRSVEDAALMLGALAGHDPLDFSTSDRPVPNYPDAVGAQQSGPRIGVVRQLFHDRADDEVRKHTQDMIGRLTDAGATCEEVTVHTDFDTLLAAHRVLMSTEAAAVHQANFSSRPDDYAPSVRGTIEVGMLTPAVTYVQAQRVRRGFRRAMLDAIEGFDVLLTPSTPAAAPKDLSTTGDPVFQSPWTTCGFPTITLPSGLSSSGLPLGIQLAASPFAEETLFSVGQWCEQVLEFDLTPIDVK